MSRVIALSGWGQPSDSLAACCGEDTTHVAYVQYDSPERLFDYLCSLTSCEVVVGWSLGAQLAARAVAAESIRPKRLIMLGAPFCFISKEQGDGGVPPMMAQEISAMYDRDPVAMVANLQALVAHGDANARAIRQAVSLPITASDIPNWRRWLDVLLAYDAAALEGAVFPETCLVHGKQDAVIYAAQAAHWKRLIPHATLNMLEGCGHAPHLHDPALVKLLIQGA